MTIAEQTRIGMAEASSCIANPVCTSTVTRALDSSPHFTGAELTAACTPLAVAIGIGAAYLVLDRFRYSHKIIASANALGQQLNAGPQALLARGSKLTQVERNFIALHHMCEEVELTSTEREDVFNGGLDTLLSWRLQLLVKMKVDRRIMEALTFMMICWLLYISAVLYGTETPPAWLGLRLVGGIVIFACSLALLIPCVGYWLGESTVRVVKRNVLRWLSEEAVRSQKAADSARVPVAE